MLEISEAQLEEVTRLLESRLSHVKAFAFGSRVVGWPFGSGPRPHSDPDIGLLGLNRDDDVALAHLRADLEESDLPWRGDLSRMEDLPQALREMIGQCGIQISTQIAHQD